MQTNTDRKKMIQNGFDTVAAGYDHPSLSFFPETAKRLLEHLQLNPADKVSGRRDDGVWFNTEVLMQ